ncbi:MAG TPA: chitobiase/beta-hexosaminidase C-terminal domain-containing protein [Verrucomicrobiae bacterium]
MKLAFSFLALSVLALATTQAATFTVTTTDDSGPGSLRQAILDANAMPGDDRITFAVSGTSMLTSALPPIADTNTVTIAGPGTNHLTVSGNNAVRIFTVNAQATATISGLTIANGLATGYANGAGIANAGTLALVNCALINNTNLGGWGGAVFNSGNLTISNATFIGNQVVGESAPSPSAAGGGGGAAGLGGALTSISGTVNITACSFIGNLALGGNGADGGSYRGSHYPHWPGGRGGGMNGGAGGIQFSGDGQTGGWGGGGGGGSDPNNPANGGAGGFGAGGGGGGCRITPGTGVGGQAGFGAGGGGSAWFIPNDSFGSGGGGGGAGLGAAIFVDSGNATIADSWFVKNQATGGYAGHGGAGAATGGSGSGSLGSVFTRDGIVLLQNTPGTVITPNTLTEIWSYAGGQLLAQAGTPAVVANGQLVLGETVARGPVLLSLQSSLAGGTILYTLDGSDPRSTPALYTAPFTVRSSTVLRAVAYNSSFSASVEMDPVEVVILPTMTASTPGGGTVSIAPSSGPYFSNSVAQISAQPNSGWTFLQWLGDASGTNPTTTVTMSRDKFVQAIFGTAVGTTVIGGGSLIADPSLPLYPFGTAIRFTAQPQTGNSFAQWGSSASGTNNPLTFVVSDPGQSIAGVFPILAASKYTLTVIEDGRGHVLSNPRANFYNSGQPVALTAIPDASQDFLGWSGDASGVQNPLLVSMVQSKVITANFTKRPRLRVGTPLEGLVEDGFRLTLTGEFGAAYEVSGSTNLLDWSPVGTITNTYGTSQLTDPVGTNLSHRFYRATAE